MQRKKEAAHAKLKAYRWYEMAERYYADNWDHFTKYLQPILECMERKLIASVGEDHEHMECSFLEKAGVFHKHYAWSYEKECRLIVELSPEMQKYAQETGFYVIRIQLSETSRRSLKDRVVRSPVYTGKTDFGSVSMLHGNVDWSL